MIGQEDLRTDFSKNFADKNKIQNDLRMKRLNSEKEYDLQRKNSIIQPK